MADPESESHANAFMDAEARLKRFLHYGSELRLYIPSGNLENTFKPKAVSSVEELLGDDEWAKKIVPTIKKVNELRTSIAPCALLYALAMVVRKARVNMEKAKTSVYGAEVQNDSPDGTEVESEVENQPSSSSNEKTSPKEGESKSDPKDVKPKKWDYIIRDAYKVARELSHDQAENLFLFTHYLREIAKTDDRKGFGEGWRRTVRKWYEFQSTRALAESVTKLYTRTTWSHADLLKLLRWKSHEDKDKDAIFVYVWSNFKKVKEKYDNVQEPRVTSVVKYLNMVDNLRHAKDADQALEYVNHHSITLDFVPPVLLNSHTIWLKLIEKMTPQELLPLICRLSRLKMFNYTEIVQKVISKFEELNQPSSDATQVLINPFQVFITRKRYEEGPNLAIEFQYMQQTEQGSNREPASAIVAGEVRADVRRQPPPKKNSEIVGCLKDLFDNSISSFAATGKKFLIAVDAQAANASKRCLYERFVSIEEGALLIALGIIRAEPADNVKLVTFTKDEGLVREIPIAVRREEQVMKTTDTMDSLKSKIHKDDTVTGNLEELIKMATKNKDKYDVFVVLGDHLLVVGEAYKALKTYQKDVHADAKIITCCLIGRHKRHLDLTMPDMFLICGFDRHVGNLIQAYSRNSF